MGEREITYCETVPDLIHILNSENPLIGGIISVPSRL